MDYSIMSGETSTGIILNNDSMTVFNGGIASETTVNSGGRLNVSAGGTANNTLVNSGGRQIVSNGGTANLTQVNAGGSLTISGGGIATGIVEYGGYVNVASDSEATFAPNAFSDFSLANGGATVHSGTTAIRTEVNFNGYLLVSSGGSVTSTTVNSRGVLSVSSGGSAVSTTLHGGYLSVFLGGTADSTSVNSGGYLLVSSGGTATKIVENGGFVNLANDANAGFMDNTFSDLLLSSGSATVHSGTTAADTTVGPQGYFLIFSGGTADNTAVNSGGSLSISSGGIATKIVENGGFVWTANGASAAFVSHTFSDLTLGGKAATVHSGTTAIDAVVNSGGSLYVFTGGTVSRATVNSGGSLAVSSGGTAAETSVAEGGKLVLTIASNTYVQGNYAGSAFEMKDAYISGYTVNSLGWLYVSSGGSADNTAVSQYGSMFVFNGGTANRTQVNSGRLYVSSGGTLNGVTVQAGGGLFIYEDGKATGTMQLETGADVSAYAGAGINFDLADRTTADAALVNNLALIHGDPSYSITISASQAEGTYRLADGAAGFDQTITISNTAADSGSLTVGNSVVLGDRICTLGFDAAAQALTLSVSLPDTTPPAAPTATADITGPTNQNVTVSVTFSEDSVQKQYSPDNSHWLNYTKSIIFITNGTLYFRGIDAAGNISEITTFTVSNIDKTPPTAPTASADITSATNQNVTVSAMFSADSVQKQYSLDDSSWLTYSKGIVFSANGTVRFRGIDAAGNISQTTTFTVSNIDKTPPTAPTASADITTVTNQNVTVSATFSADSVQKQYSLNNSNWNTYANGIVLSNNGTVYFRGIDAVGNISQTTTFTVSNIDKTPPTAPTASADITGPTNQNVTVSATFSGDSVQKQYSLDDSNWLTYSKGIVLNNNGTVYFRGIDAAGNISDITTFTVSNIDKTPPSAPTASADITSATNQNVTVSAAFSSDSVQKQYSLNNSNWNAYAGGIVFSANGTVRFRGIDAAGNVSKITAFTVSNIDKVSPAAPTAGADITEKTHQNVTVSATFSADSVQKQYSLNNSSWNAYAGGVVFAVNGTVYFRGIDAAGNVSETVSYTVGNILPSYTISGDQSGSHPLELSVSGKYRLTGSFGDINGSVTVWNGGKKAGNGSIKNGMLVFNKGKPILLNSTLETSVQVTVKKGTDTNYTATLAADLVYDRGDTDSRENQQWLGSISGPGPLVADGWVGYGDEFDYLAFTLEKAANLILDYTAGDAVKFTLCNAAGKSMVRSSLKAGTSLTTKPKLLEAGQYYLVVQSANAKKGGSADYTVTLNGNSRFFPAGDRTNDTWQAASEKPAKLAGEEITGWVGFGDAKDFIKFQLDGDGQIQLDLSPETAAAYQSKQIKLTCLDGNGKSVGLGAFDGDTLVSKKPVLAGEYYLGVTCANVKKFDTSYSITTGLLA